ncbi:polysaccharide deacetylase family protein [Melaminivora suipulveris]|uniref:Polysaccharide deacetylase family protein n=1 Tax=Melaminivora suipulveris TaxID=2109913 RepID=A0A2R3QCB6_9BURK|nr:polysaccharide deacetylase family protein [Melaminivora suipulveris]
MARAWKPAPLVTASAAVHGAAILGAALEPALWPWSAAAVAANHALLTTVGLLPRSRGLGDNITRLPVRAPAVGPGRVALTIDDGPDPEVTPRVLDLLDELGLVASFFLIGHRAQRHPALCHAIVARGHRVENHGHSHSHAFSLFGPARMRADIMQAQSAITDASGQEPRFFRPTAGLRNPFLDPVLARLDLRLASWTRRAYDTREPQAPRVLQRLCRNLADGDILLLHDGHAARMADGAPVVLAVLPPLAARLAQQGLATITLDQAFPPA